MRPFEVTARERMRTEFRNFLSKYFVRSSRKSVNKGCEKVPLPKKSLSSKITWFLLENDLQQFTELCSATC